VKVAVLVINNAVEVKTDAKTGKAGVTYAKDASDVIKNTAIDAIADITTGGLNKGFGKEAGKLIPQEKISV